MFFPSEGTKFDGKSIVGLKRDRGWRRKRKENGNVGWIIFDFTNSLGTHPSLLLPLPSSSQRRMSPRSGANKPGREIRQGLSKKKQCAKLCVDPQWATANYGDRSTFAPLPQSVDPPQLLAFVHPLLMESGSNRESQSFFSSSNFPISHWQILPGWLWQLPARLKHLMLKKAAS